MTYIPERLLATAGPAPILLTGSAGYLGTELADQFRSAGVPFVGVDKRPDRGKGECQLNLADSGATNDLFREVMPGAVIHTGTHSALAYRDDFKTAFREDLDAVMNLLENLEQRPDARLVFFSSTYIYSGLDSSDTVDETTVLNPAHNFGVAKLFFEQFLIRSHSNTVVFRLSSVFGHGAQRHPNALANMAEECKTSGKLTVWGAGNRRMQYVYLEEVILSVLEALALPPGLYNLGGVDYTSVTDAATQIAGFFGSQVEYLRDEPEGDTLPFMSTEKLRAAMRERREYSFSKALEGYLTAIPG